MNEYYRKNAPKLKKGMNGFLKLIAGEQLQMKGRSERCRIYSMRTSWAEMHNAQI